jgi:hypothetical protein
MQQVTHLWVASTFSTSYSFSPCRASSGVPFNATRRSSSLLHIFISEIYPGGSKTFCAHPERPWGPPSLLYNGYRISSPEVKRSERWVHHPPACSAVGKERVELQLCAFMAGYRVNLNLEMVSKRNKRNIFSGNLKQ